MEVTDDCLEEHSSIEAYYAQKIPLLLDSKDKVLTSSVVAKVHPQDQKRQRIWDDIKDKYTKK